MIRLRQVSHLARHLEVSIDELESALEHVGNDYEERVLIDPKRPNKLRSVVCVKGAARTLQSKFLRRVLIPKLQPSPHSYGGVRGRDIKANAKAHLRSTFVFKTDISDFYPSIKYRRVYDIFLSLGCSPDVARICTRLCTYRHHLALGLITSPFLADQAMGGVDRRIGEACRKADLVYTRYVDDVTISAPFRLEKSGFENVVRNILRQNKFQVNETKSEFGELTKHVSITGVRVVKGHLDVRKEYADELERQISDHLSLASGGVFVGPYYTFQQVRGRLEFACWVNPGRRRYLVRKFRAVPWGQVKRLAESNGLVAQKKALLRATEQD